MAYSCSFRQTTRSFSAPDTALNSKRIPLLTASAGCVYIQQSEIGLKGENSHVLEYMKGLAGQTRIMQALYSISQHDASSLQSSDIA